MIHSPSQRGSAIIMLFVAVALFGALAYAFMQNSRGSTAMMSDEQAKVYAQQIIAYGNDIKTAIKRLKLRGCTNEQISFENTVSGVNYTNPNAPATKSCHVFDTAGGGLTWKNPPAPFYQSSANWYEGKYGFMEGAEWSGFGTTCAAASCSDLIMTLYTPGKLNEKVCSTINQILGFPSIIEDTYIGGFRFLGAYSFFTAGNPDNTFANEAGSLVTAGKSPVCFKRTSDGAYLYIHLLIAR